MPIEYLGLSSINGPLIALEGLQDAFFDEIVEKVHMEQNGTVTFSLKCGLGLNIAREEL